MKRVCNKPLLYGMFEFTKLVGFTCIVSIPYLIDSSPNITIKELGIITKGRVHGRDLAYEISPSLKGLNLEEVKPQCEW